MAQPENEVSLCVIDSVFFSIFILLICNKIKHNKIKAITLKLDNANQQKENNPKSRHKNPRPTCSDSVVHRNTKLKGILCTQRTNRAWARPVLAASVSESSHELCSADLEGFLLLLSSIPTGSNTFYGVP